MQNHVAAQWLRDSSLGQGLLARALPGVAAVGLVLALLLAFVARPLVDAGVTPEQLAAARRVMAESSQLERAKRVEAWARGRGHRRPP